LATPVPGKASPKLVAPIPRNTSLEVILLDRKRRLTVASSTPNSTASLPLAPPPLSGAIGATADAHQRTSGLAIAKGTRFKSSPLGGGDRSGVVVAEKVKEEMGVGRTKQQLNVEHRIPDPKEKEGHGDDEMHDAREARKVTGFEGKVK